MDARSMKRCGRCKESKARLNSIKHARLDHEVTEPEFHEWLAGPPCGAKAAFTTIGDDQWNWAPR